MLLPQILVAQNAKNPVPKREPLRISTDLVKMDISVTDAEGDLVGGLHQNDFRVQVDGIDQPVLFFASVNEPSNLVVLVETSPAVYLISSQHLQACYALLDGLSPGDRVALVAYDRAPRVLLGFTPDKQALAAALGEIQYTLGTGELNFYDSVSAVLDSLATTPGKHAIVMLTTGIDSSSSQRWESLANKLRYSDVVVYPIALGGSLREYGSKPSKSRKKISATGIDQHASDAVTDSPGFQRANEILLSMAAITGGRAYFPQSYGEFVAAYKQIASVLRHQYLLGVAAQHDGRFHAIAVQVQNDEQLKSEHSRGRYFVHTRQGYVAPN